MSIFFKSVNSCALRAHAKPLSFSVIFLTFAFSLGASSKDSESGRSVVLGKCFLRGRSCCEGRQPLVLRESDRALDADPGTEAAASREIVFPLNLDAEPSVPPKFRNQGHLAPLPGVCRQKRLPSKASGAKPKAGLLCSLPVAQRWRVWRPRRWARG